MAPHLSRQDSTTKRKAPPASAPTPQHQQSSIASHLVSNHKGDSAKRRRVGSSESEQRLTPPIIVPLRTETMYSFGTSHTPIDLSNSSPQASRPRRISVGARVVQPSSPYVGAKKLVIKNSRPKSTAAPDHATYVSKTFGELEDALTAIFSTQRPDLSNEELYKGVEYLCKLGKAPELTKKLSQRCKEHVLKDFRDQLIMLSEQKSTAVLKAAMDVWAQWTQQLSSVRSIFFYLDRSHLLATQNPSIHESAVALFRSYVFGDSLLQPKIVDGACDLLSAERSGNAESKQLFADAVKMLHELNVYTSVFEPRMLGFSQTFLADWSDRKNSEMELPDFVTAAAALIDAEMSRCDQYALDSSTRRELLALLEHHLIERREADLTNRDSVADLLDADNARSLEQLYLLLHRRRLGLKLKEAFWQWIFDTGSAIIVEKGAEEQMIPRLLGLKQKLDGWWRTAFQRDETLGITLRDSFDKFINKSRKSEATHGTDNSKPAEMIAKYVDQLLRSGSKAIPTSLTTSTLKGPTTTTGEEEENEEVEVDEDAEVNKQLDQVLDLFRFVEGKTTFEAFYKNDLARRLLMDRSASKDAEIAMLERLKTECGAQFTTNLEQMFKDIELGKEEMAAYRNRLEATNSRLDVDLNVNVLSSAAWPAYPDIKVIIPSEIQRSIDAFELVYNQKHSGRKLHWKHSLAHCQLRAKFPKGSKELVVSSFQAIILLLFNQVGKDEHLSYDRIKAESGLSDFECKKTLQSLACARLRPLTKHPKGREINETDTFTVNLGFSHDRARVKINAIQLKETKEENKATHERIAADRQFETQAAIVRIMKSSKRITHQQLIVETITATRKRGTLQPADIKKQIDKLIEKEYMEREDDGSLSRSRTRIKLLANLSEDNHTFYDCTAAEESHAAILEKIRRFWIEMNPDLVDVVTPRLRKNGKAQSCEPCRKHKLRCDHGSPHCGRCIRLGRTSTCIYDPAPLTKANGSRKMNPSPSPVTDSPDGQGRKRPSEVIQKTSKVPRLEGVSSKMNPLSLRSGGDIGYPRTRNTTPPRLYYGTTAFSAIFDENKESLGDSIRDDSTYECKSLSSRHALKQFCINILAWLPTREASEKAIRRYARIAFFVTFHLPTLTAFHERFWDKYGSMLEHPRKPEALEKIAEDFYEGTYRSPFAVPASNDDCLDMIQNRWEMLGVLFLAYGSFSFMCAEDDPTRVELVGDGSSRKEYGLSMLELADACVLLCEELDPGYNWLSLSLLQRAIAFQSACNVDGDLSIDLWKRCGALMSAITALGLHDYSGPYKGCPLFVEMNKRSFATAFGFLTSMAVFLGRPPLLSARYCSTPAVLDVSDEALMSGSLSNLADLVDENGWNKQNKIYPATLCRSHYLSSFNYEAILELSLAKNEHDNSLATLRSKVQGIRQRIETLWMHMPEILRAPVSKELLARLSQWEFCGVVCARLSYHNQRFLLARCDPDDGGPEYLYTAQMMLQDVLFIWNVRDRLNEHHEEIRWFLIWCGVPSAAALGISLWKHANCGSPLPPLSRSDVIQNLSLAVAALDWISPQDGNYILCVRARKMLKHLINGILSPEPPDQRQQHSMTTPQSTNGSDVAYDFANMPELPTFGVELEDWFLGGWNTQEPMGFN